jgi:hypothetical protein
MRTFTPEQIRALSKNKNVKRCGGSSVIYRKRFKAEALRQYNEEGLTAVDIFESAGFDLDAIGKRVPNRLMHQWNQALKVKTGIVSPPPENLEPSEPVEKKIRSGSKIRTLKAKVVYLKAENDFLANLRVRRR